MWGAVWCCLQLKCDSLVWCIATYHERSETFGTRASLCLHAWQWLVFAVTEFLRTSCRRRER